MIGQDGTSQLGAGQTSVRPREPRDAPGKRFGGGFTGKGGVSARSQRVRAPWSDEFGVKAVVAHRRSDGRRAIWQCLVQAVVASARRLPEWTWFAGEAMSAKVMPSAMGRVNDMQGKHTAGNRAGGLGRGHRR